MTIGEVIQNHWAIIIAGIGFVAWLVRLEAAGNANTKAIAAESEARKEADNRHERALEKHTDTTERMFEEIRRDIKAILARLGSAPE
jgi:uncharacterized membrane-anchored protein YhcB (DUF1043 family)